MKVKATFRDTWAIGFPMVVAGLSEKILEVTDTVFLARYGIIELGAVGLADAMFEMLVFVAVGLAGGLQILVARRAGQGRDQDIGRLFTLGLLLITGISTLLIAAVYGFAPWIVATIASSSQVGQAVGDFLQVYTVALLFHSVNLAYAALYAGLARTGVLMRAMIALACTNILLDYLLIFGNFGFPELGIQGAAWGSLVAEVIACVFFTVYTFTRLPRKKFGPFRLQGLSQAQGKLLVGLSIPVSLEALVETGRWFAFFLIVERMGETQLAISNIVYACYALFFIPTEAFSEAVFTMVSNLIGQGKASHIRVLLRRSIAFSLRITLPVVVLASFFPEFVLMVFSSDPDIIADSIPSLRIVCIATAIMIAADQYASAVAGTGDTTFAFITELLFTVVTLTLVYISALVMGMDLVWVWSAEIVGALLVWLVSYYWLFSGKWQRLSI